jgi:hypothetical protein
MTRYTMYKSGAYKPVHSAYCPVCRARTVHIEDVDNSHGILFYATDPIGQDIGGAVTPMYLCCSPRCRDIYLRRLEHENCKYHNRDEINYALATGTLTFRTSESMRMRQSVPQPDDASRIIRGLVAKSSRRAPKCTADPF